jgi:hypothetical protein
VNDSPYEKPRIVEAVIDLRFATSFASKPFAEALQLKLGADFVAKLEEHESIELSTEVGEGAISAARLLPVTRCWAPS